MPQQCADQEPHAVIFLRLHARRRRTVCSAIASSHRRLHTVLFRDHVLADDCAIGLLKRADEDGGAGLEEIGAVWREGDHRRAGVDHDFVLAILVLELERDALALGYRLELDHVGVGHGVVLAPEVPGIVAFARAHAGREDQHFLCVKLAVFVRDGGRADELPLLDVAELRLLNAEDAEFVGEIDGHHLAVARFHGELLTLKLLYLAAHIGQGAVGRLCQHRQRDKRGTYAEDDWTHSHWLWLPLVGCRWRALAPRPLPSMAPMRRAGRPRHFFVSAGRGSTKWILDERPLLQ